MIIIGLALVVISGIAYAATSQVAVAILALIGLGLLVYGFINRSKERAVVKTAYAHQKEAENQEIRGS